ncbi:MAG: hypothetical protein OIF32_12990 [Campylobacterales bacterium]|nr:hypothetical protein [Campylobacterales bacterium]
MRVATVSPYINFNNNQQDLLGDLTKVNDQISSGKKIKYGYEDMESYLDFLKYDHEIKALQQVSDTASKAESFANNTDTALSTLKKTLESFKVKLLDAANGSHSKASTMAIAKDLEALRNNMLDTANTSIGGKYLFSGTDLANKPFNEDGKYSGNNSHINAVIGDGVQVAYNTHGLDLAYGYSSDYSKKITTNVQKFNMRELHHKVLDDNEPNGVDTQVPIKKDDSIMELVGQPDDSKSTYFYIRGKRPDGSGIKTKFEMNNNGTVEDLMDKIGREFGNTEIYKAVNVELNHYGQFEVTDIQSGRMLTDFHIVGSNVDTNNLNEITATSDAHIHSFMESRFGLAKDSATVSMEHDYYDDRMIRMNTTLRRFDTEEVATKFTKTSDLFPPEVDQLKVKINGTDYTTNINSNILVEDMLTDIKSLIKTATGEDVDVEIQSGQIYIFDLYKKDPVSSFSITAVNSVSGKEINSFTANDGLAYDKARFQKDGATLTSNVSQVDRSTSTYATDKTQLINVASMENLEEQVIKMDFLDVNGVKKVVEITLRDNPDENGHLSTFQIVEPAGNSTVYDIYDEFGEKTAASPFTYTELRIQGANLDRSERTADGVTYKQLMNVMQTVITDTLPTTNDFDSFQKAVVESGKSADVSLNEFGQIVIKDYTTSESKVQFSMYGADSDRFDNYDKTMTKTLKETFKGLKEEQGWNLKNTDLDKTLDVTFGFPFSGPLTISGTDFQGNPATVDLANTTTLQELMDAIDNTFGDGTASAGFVTDIEDNNLILRDNSENGKTLANLNFSFAGATIDMQVEKSPPLTFSANNALTVDKGSINFFESLDNAISSVESQNVRANSDSSDPRSIGVQNSIEVVDHMLDHLNRLHTQNGSVSNTLIMAKEKSELMELNTKELSSMAIDTDIGEAMLTMNQRSLAYQSLLATISKISQLNLVNYI